MPAGLELEPGVGPLADDLRDHFLVAAELGGALRDDLGLPALPLGVARVHAEQVGGEERRLVAAGAGADLEEDIALVVRVPGQQRLLQIGLEPLHAAARRLELIVGERPHGGVGGHFLGGLSVALRLTEPLVERDDAGQLGMLAREPPELLQVARRAFRGKQAVEVLQAPDQAVELGAQRRLHLMRNRRASVSARARRSSPAASFSACVGPCISLLVRACDSDSSTRAASSPRCRSFSARSTSPRRACSACSRSARISGTLSRACIQCMNWPTCDSMIASAWSTAERRASRFSDTISARSSTV